MNKYLYLTLLPGALMLQNVAAQEANVFSEQAGRLVIEVESTAAVADWHKSTDFADYRGSGHYEWTGSSNTNVKNAGDGILTYYFTINTPGNYEFRLRSRIGEGNDKTESNDAWVRFPTGSNISGEQALNDWTKTYMNQLGVWTWTTKTVDNVGADLRQSFRAGDHILQISGRSAGFVIDRFALYRYDTVNFNDDEFDGSAESPSSNKTVTVSSPDPTAENTVTTDTDTDTDNSASQTPIATTTQDWQVIANQTTANSCIANTISLRPLSDIYVESNEIKNSGDLRIEDNRRKTLLKFDLSNVPATATAALLTWSIGSDNGDGTIVLSAGSQSTWNENEVSQLPDTSHQIGSYNGTWSHNKRYGFPFDYALLDSGLATVIMEMEQGSNDVAITPTVNDGEPRLELTGTGDFCADYEANQNGAGPNESAPEDSSELDLGQANSEQTDTADGGGGGLGWLELLLLSSTIVTGLRSRALQARTHYNGRR